MPARTCSISRFAFSSVATNGRSTAGWKIYRRRRDHVADGWAFDRRRETAQVRHRLDLERTFRIGAGKIDEGTRHGRNEDGENAAAIAPRQNAHRLQVRPADQVLDEHRRRAGHGFPGVEGVAVGDAARPPSGAADRREVPDQGPRLVAQGHALQPGEAVARRGIGGRPIVRPVAQRGIELGQMVGAFDHGLAVARRMIDRQGNEVMLGQGKQPHDDGAIVRLLLGRHHARHRRLAIGRGRDFQPCHRVGIAVPPPDRIPGCHVEAARKNRFGIDQQPDCAGEALRVEPGGVRQEQVNIVGRPAFPGNRQHFIGKFARQRDWRFLGRCGHCPVTSGTTSNGLRSTAPLTTGASRWPSRGLWRDNYRIARSSASIPSKCAGDPLTTHPDRPVRTLG